MYKLKSTERYKELVHFCRQYHEWEKLYAELDGKIGKSNDDVTAYAGVARGDYNKAMSLIERTAAITDPDYYEYIMKAVTTNCSLSQLGLPCDKDVFKFTLNRFYWELNRVKGI